MSGKPRRAPSPPLLFMKILNVGAPCSRAQASTSASCASVEMIG